MFPTMAKISNVDFGTPILFFMLSYAVCQWHLIRKIDGNGIQAEVSVDILSVYYEINIVVSSLGYCKVGYKTYQSHVYTNLANT